MITKKEKVEAADILRRIEEGSFSAYEVIRLLQLRDKSEVING